MIYAITVKILSATDHAGTRYRVSTPHHKATTYPRDYALTRAQQARAVADKYAETNGIAVKLIGAPLDDGEDLWAFVSAES